MHPESQPHSGGTSVEKPKAGKKEPRSGGM
jgi:hypothetical protein